MATLPDIPHPYDDKLEAMAASSPLHVLTLTPFFPSEENEVNGCFIAEPLQELGRFGVHSSVIAVSPIYHPRKHPGALAVAEWVRYPQIPGNLGLSSAGMLLYACLQRQVRKLHAKEPIDVIHAHATLPCGHAAQLLSRQLKVPFVVTVHGLDVFNTCFVEGMPAEWRRKVAEGVYLAARTVLCVSGKVQKILKTGTPAETRSAVVYNGVDSNLFSPCPEKEASDPEILVVGNLVRGKGHDIVLRAVENLKALFPQLSCRVIGEGPERVQLEALARDLGIGSQVQFMGRQGRRETSAAMRRCTVFALPSRNEALGCVYLEAMSCGKPAIGCRGQGVDEVIEHGTNGWLIPADGLEEAVQGLSVLLGSTELRRRIGKAARQTILAKFTLAHQAQSLARTYRNGNVIDETIE